MIIERMLSNLNAAEPDCLLKLLRRIAISAFVLIISVSGFGIYHVYESYVVQNAEKDAARISQLIVAQEEVYLSRAELANNPKALLDPVIFNSLDRSLRKFLTPFDILKIKVFNTQGIVIYSTDPTIIGEDSSASQQLANALAGNIDSKLQTKESIHNLQFVERNQVDVVETYMPIYNPQNQIIGSFEIYKDITSHRSEIMSGVLSSVAILAGILILIFGLVYQLLRISIAQLRATQVKLQHIATTDELTGLLNRREIMSRAEQEFLRHQRACIYHPDSSFSAMMIDIDHFKQVNDHFGHTTGDAVLRQFSELLQEQCRGYTHVGRYGGEEFLILLPDTDLDKALVVAERLRMAVKSSPISHDSNSVTVTLSVGISTVNEQDSDFDQILVRADRALYHAKELGRDRVVTEYCDKSDDQEIINPSLFCE
ncbi:MAG: GGDEF domain-containing protein [Motiliproteus sp.]|nr:GGDEF domain-containing protein [Motiliproteus sp.]MCW9051640.1 GGDEF domain-containing protein [Motiliproteus sp.]